MSSFLNMDQDEVMWLTSTARLLLQSSWFRTALSFSSRRSMKSIIILNDSTTNLKHTPLISGDTRQDRAGDGCLPVQVSRDGQVGESQRRHQSLSQTLLLLQDGQQVSAQLLKSLAPPGCRSTGNRWDDNTGRRDGGRRKLTEMEGVSDVRAVHVDL